jgi:unsaturated rhamnogalacturonyl hydrolase
LNVWQFREEKNAATLSWKILFVCLHFEIFLRTGQVKYIKTFLEVAEDFRECIPRDKDGAVAYSVRPNSQRRIFIDMLQGYAIFMARAGWLSGDSSFFDECVDQYQLFRQILRNPKTGLWHQGRGWFADSDMISPGHWNRGQAWVLRGMVESLCYIPKSHSKYDLMLNMLREFAERLIKYQDVRGLWHQVTDNSAAYPETSGTAMFVHYLYKAIHNGWLPDSIYRPCVEKGLTALLGFVHRDGLVANTSLGSGPLMNVDGYLHRPAVPGDSHSIGTTLMACAAPYLSGIHRRIQH